MWPHCFRIPSLFEPPLRRVPSDARALGGGARITGPDIIMIITTITITNVLIIIWIVRLLLLLIIIIIRVWCVNNS